MDSDVLSVELCPDWSPSSIKARLEASLHGCRYLQAAVGYWTVTDQFLRGKIAPALRHSDAFLCTDIHLPTDIDALADLVENGAHVRLMAKDIGGFVRGVSKDHAGLLHAKMLLFRSADGPAELWIGSHNWTKRAISGINIEASVIIRLRDSSPIFREAANYLQKIKRECIEFETDKVEQYKQLQQSRAARAVKLVRLTGPDAESLVGQEVTLFASDASDVRKLNAYGSTVYLVMKDSDTSSEYTYRTKVILSGEPSNIQFLPCRHSLHDPKRQEHWLTPVQPIPKWALSQSTAGLFATLTVLESDAETEFEYPRTGAAWEAVSGESDALVLRLEAEDRADLFGNRAPIVKVPEFFGPRDMENPPPELPGSPPMRLVQVAVIAKGNEATNRGLGGAS